MPLVPTFLPSSRLLVLLSIATLAATAPAITLNLKSIGTGVGYDDSMGGGDFFLDADETSFLVQNTFPASAPFSDAYLGLLGLDGMVDGYLAYADGLNDNALNVHLTVGSDVEANGLRTIDGTWEYLSGLGDYSDYAPADSTGRWSFVWNRTDDTTQIALTGGLNNRQAVPEPAPLGVLALGAVALMRRKRR